MVADDGVKKTKFTKVNLKNLISFTEWFMGPAASHLVSRGELQWSTERERFSEAGQRSNKQKNTISD